MNHHPNKPNIVLSVIAQKLYTCKGRTRSYSRSALLLLNFIMATTACWISHPAWALDSDQYQVMHVISNTATYDRNQHTIIYDGAVQMDQGTSHLDGDKVIVYQLPATNTNKIQKVVALGNPAHYSTLPQPNKARLFVEALKITYDPTSKTVLLEGNGKVTQEGNVFSGPHIWYDMANGVVHSLAAPGKQRTEMVIQPQIAPKKPAVVKKKH